MEHAGRPPPTTFEAIETVALRQPQRLAVVEDKRAWTYGNFHLDLVRFTEALHREGIRRGERVAVSRIGFYLQLVILLACENLGAVTSSFGGDSDPDAQALLGMVDWVVSGTLHEPREGLRSVLVDQAFVDKAQAIEPQRAVPCPRAVLAFHEPHRISRTSGSSGRSRFMMLPRETQEFWIRAGAENGGYGSDTRLLVASPMVINAAYARSCACLRLGAAVISATGEQLAQVPVSHVLALPMRLEELLDELPPGFVARSKIVVGTVGGFVTPALRERAQSVFGGRILSRYGANETCGICEDLDAAGVGLLSAGIDVRIVDQEGRDLPEGDYGIIAVRTPGMVQGYMDDPEATRAAFRDGWFYSGDWGALVGPRKLHLAGRHDDLVNVGGLKVPAVVLESRIGEIAEVREVVVLSLNLQGGSATLGVVLVLAQGASQEDVLPRLRQVLPPYATARVICMDALPRMATGKLDRMALMARLQTTT